MARLCKYDNSQEATREVLLVNVQSRARAVEVTPARINEIVRERRGITADTALRLARFFGTDVQSWMNLQAHYDIECAQAEVGRALTRIKPFQRPVRQATA